MKSKKMFIVVFMFVAMLLLQSGLEAAWVQKTGSLRYVAVGADGTALGIDSNDQAWYWGAVWARASHYDLPAGLKTISVGCASLVWAVDNDGKAYRYNSGWQQVTPSASIDFKKIAVSCNESVWALSESAILYQYDNATDTWTQRGVSGDFSIGSDGTLWYMSSNQMFKLLNGSFTMVPGISFSQNKSIAVGCAWEIWSVVTSMGNTLIGEFKQGNWYTSLESFTPSQIAAGCDGSVWLVDTNNNIYKWE